MTKHFTYLAVAMISSLLLQGCSVLGSRDVDAPVESPAGAPVDDPAERIVVAPVPATRIAPPERVSPPPGSAPQQKLIIAANQYRHAGQYARAAATLERGLRIAPRDATLWNQLAEVRLLEGKWRLALNMAAKSNSLAMRKPALQARNWRIMARAYEELGQPGRAENARQRARELSGGG